MSSSHDNIIDLAIVIVTYNAEKTINRCLSSISSQTVKPNQVIVVDGKSTDRTVEMISNYRDILDTFISEVDNGVYDAMNKGLSFVRSSYFLFLNSDDYFSSSKVLQVYKKIIDKAQPSIICCNIDCVDGLVVKRVWRFCFGNDIFMTATRMAHPGCVMKLETLKIVGGFKVCYPIAADFDLITRYLNHNSDIYHIDDVLVKMEVGGLSNRGFYSTVRQNLEVVRCLRSFNKSLPYVFKFYLDRILFKTRQMFHW